MVVTKQAQLIDAQNGISEKVYFKIIAETKDHTNNTRVVIFATCKKEVTPQGQPERYTQFGNDHYAVFKESTFISLFGEMTINAFEAAKDQLLIEQIAYINTYTWTGTEAQPAVKFWDLGINDLEII